MHACLAIDANSKTVSASLHAWPLFHSHRTNARNGRFLNQLAKQITLFGVASGKWLHAQSLPSLRQSSPLRR